MPLGSYCPVAVSVTVYSKIVLYCFSSELSLHPCCFSTTLVCLLAQKGGEFLCLEEMILEDHPTLLGPFVVQRYLLGEYSQVFPPKKADVSSAEDKGCYSFSQNHRLFEVFCDGFTLSSLTSVAEACSTRAGCLGCYPALTPVSQDFKLRYHKHGGGFHSSPKP